MTVHNSSCRRQNHGSQGAMLRRAAPAFAVLLCLAAPARAVDAPYEKDMLRVAEVLGSLHYLRNLCGEDGNVWREEMEKLLGTENPDETRRARYVASFNKGYRSFGSTYTNCTPSALEAIGRYLREGENLTKEIAARYGN